MLKLIKKDIKLLLSNRGGVALVLLGIPLLLALIGDDRHGNAVGIIYLITSFISIMSFDYDKSVANTQKIFLSLPITRKEIIYSKYIMVPIYFVFCIILINLYGIAMNIFNININLTTNMNQIIGLFVLISIVLGISLPLYFSTSSNVARGISYFIILITNNVRVANGGGNEFNGRLFTYLGGFWAIVIGVFILLASMGVSIILYNEFEP